MLSGLTQGFLASLIMFASSPTSTNYVLPSYDIGSGGTDVSTSTNYSLNGVAGSVGGDQHSSTSYSLKDGLNPTQDANVPPAPTLSNPASYYDRLQLVLNTGGNPTDARYLVAISSDGFATTNYVQGDNSIGSTYTGATFRTYASYGAGSGFLILGLSPSTTYTVKVKAIRGNFTESAFGPVTGAVATAGQTISFGLSTTLTPTPPYAADFSNLTAGAVSSANADINLSLSTNAQNGGAIYIESANGSLFSASQSFSISSSSTDLALAANGYGAQVTSTSQSSGGPVTAQAPYNGTLDNVGQLSSVLSQLITTANPVSGAAATIRLKAKVDAITPATSDFSDTITIIAAMNY